MDVLKIAKAYLRELLSDKTMDRIPEPELLMEQAEQVSAYRRGAAPDGSLAPVHHFAVSEASKVMQGCKTVVDLGIGSGHVITKMALINPGIQFIGLDLSDEMLKTAKAEIDRLSITNIRLEKMDITKLDQLAQRGIPSVDGVMSTMALHHLPTVDSLHQVIKSAFEVMTGPSKKYFFFDFGRIKNDSTIREMLELHPSTSDVLFEDGFNSQKAAFTIEEFKAGFEKLASPAISEDIRYESIFIVPYLIKIQSEGHRQLTPQQKAVIDGLYGNLSPQNRQLVKIMNLMFH